MGSRKKVQESKRKEINPWNPRKTKTFNRPCTSKQVSHPSAAQNNKGEKRESSQIFLCGLFISQVFSATKRLEKGEEEDTIPLIGPKVLGRISIFDSTVVQKIPTTILKRVHVILQPTAGKQRLDKLGCSWFLPRLGRCWVIMQWKRENGFVEKYQPGSVDRNSSSRSSSTPSLSGTRSDLAIAFGAVSVYGTIISALLSHMYFVESHVSLAPFWRLIHVTYAPFCSPCMDGCQLLVPCMLLSHVMQRKKQCKKTYYIPYKATIFFLDSI